MRIGVQASAWGVSRRQGTVLPTLALVIVALTAFLAFSIDVGMLVTAKAQAQNAADLAALTAARSLNGNSSAGYNQSTATTNAQNILAYNSILGQSVQSSQLQLSYGSYDYSSSAQTFSANFPATSGVPLTAVAATVTSASTPTSFGSICGVPILPTVTATATAVHRPRDIALVVDLSGSMRMGTCMGFDFYTNSRSTNNADPVYPTFGHYSSSSAGMLGQSTTRTSADNNYSIPPTNSTAATTSYALTFVNSFYSNAAYATTLVRAFDSYTSTDGGKTWTAPTSGSPILPPTTYSSVPGGDVPLFKQGSSSTYATNVYDVLGSSTRSPSWELDGYSSYTSGSLTSAASGQSSYTSAPFYGYTQGPNYYGKTFFIWPPDPRKPLTTTSNSGQIKQFLKDFGYTDADFNGTTTGPPLKGIYNSTTTTGSQTWPWPNDSGSTLSSYLTSNVYIPGGSRKLATSDSQYQQIMRLYSWNYAIDSLGTTPCDWRVRFFGTNDNTKLFNSSGSLNTPGSSTYTINYNEILRWISQSPCPFPSQLRAGRIKYYGSIPTSITGSWPSFGGTDQRFWVEYINYVLGFVQTGTSSYTDISAMAGYGSDFNWGTPSINSPPGGNQYMSYTDIPNRPRLRLWFGPLTLTDFLQNFNMWCYTSGYYVKTAGDGYEAPLYCAKQAFLGAVDEMQNNHPNDWFSMIAYSWPRTGASSTWSVGYNNVSGRYNCALCPLGTNYAYARSALLYPFSTINADGSCNNTEVTPYDSDPATSSVPSANFMDVPRGDGETCFAMGLMLAYNQFACTSSSDGTLRSYVTSSPITFPTGMAGGLGRKGAQKLIIFETDGLPNTTASATLTTSSDGTYKYYPIRYDMNKPSSSEYPTCTNYTTNNSSTTTSQIYTIVQQLASDYGSTRNPFRLYAIGFGPVFQGTDSSSAQQTLQSMQYYAGTQSSASTALPSSQIITGTDSQMTANMNTAFTTILQGGVQIALIK